MLIQEMTPNCDEAEAELEEAPLASAFEKRAAEIEELARMQLTEEIRCTFNRELEARTASMRGTLDEGTDAELRAEIAAAEEHLQQKDAEIAENMGSEPFNLGLSLKLKEQKLEITSYLKGLNFHASKAGRS